MTTDTSEKGLENLICAALTSFAHIGKESSSGHGELPSREP